MKQPQTKNPPYVGIILQNEAAKVLLIQRDVAARVKNPGKWGIPGGVAEGEETVDQAIRREVMEEIGLSLEAYQLHLVEYDEEEQRERFIFHGRTTTRLSELRLGEGQRFGYFTLDEAIALDLGPFTRRYLERFRGGPPRSPIAIRYQ